MPAGPVGSVWSSGAWLDTVWEAGAWGDAVAGIDPLAIVFTVAAEDRTFTVPEEDRTFIVRAEGETL